jgi:hypothetical protein
LCNAYSLLIGASHYGCDQLVVLDDETQYNLIGEQADPGNRMELFCYSAEWLVTPIEAITLDYGSYLGYVKVRSLSSKTLRRRLRFISGKGFKAITSASLDG